MYYLFYAMNNGYIPMGNDGMQEISFSTVRNLKKLETVAKKFLGNRAGHIYLISEWTDTMSNATPSQFEAYVARYGVEVAHS